MAMRLGVSYTPYAKSSREKTGGITMFAQFEEGSLLSENNYYTEISDKCDDDSIMPPLIME